MNFQNSTKFQNFSNFLEGDENFVDDIFIFSVSKKSRWKVEIFRKRGAKIKKTIIFCWF